MATYLVHKHRHYQLLSSESSSVREYILIPVDRAGFVVLEHDLSVQDKKEGKK